MDPEKLARLLRAAGATPRQAHAVVTGEGELVDRIRAAGLDTTQARSVLDGVANSTAGGRARMAGYSPLVMGGQTGSTAALSPGGVRNALQGPTLGAADEMEAAFRAFGKKPTYSESIQEIRESLEDYRRGVGPVQSAVEEGVAGVLGAAVTAPAAITAFPMLGNTTRGMALRSQVGRGIGVGGATGGIYGFNAGEGLAGRMMGAAIGGPIGMLAGMAAPLLAEAATGIGRTIRSAGEGGGKEIADEVIQRQIGRTGQGPQQLIDKLNEGDFLADVSPGMQRLGRAAQAVPHDFVDDIDRTLAARAENMIPTANVALTEATGQADNMNVVQLADDLSARAREGAKGLYDASYYTPDGAPRIVDDDVVAGIMGRSVGGHSPLGTSNTKVGSWARDAWEEAMELARLDQQPIHQFVRVTDDGIRITPSVQVLDYFKRALDGTLEPLYKPGVANRGLSNNFLRKLKDQVRDPLVNAIDEAVPEYKDARKFWAGELEMQGALEAGQTAVRSTPNQVAKDIAGLTEGAQDLYRLGYVDAVRATRFGTARGGRTLTTRMAAEQGRLEKLFPGSSIDEFMETVRTLENQNRTANMVVGGSPTARIQQDVEGMLPRPDRGVMRNIAQARPREALGFAAAGTASHLSGVGRQNVAGNVAKQLFSADPRSVLTRHLGVSDDIAIQAKNEVANRLMGSYLSGWGTTRLVNMLRR